MALSTMWRRTSRRRAPLTDEQKKDRRDNDLCMYCGDPEHELLECYRSLSARRFVTDNTKLENLLIPNSIASPASTALKKRDETSKEVGLLAIPRELRDQIYEELLYQDDFQIPQFRVWRKLDPKILGVSWQIYHEASEILYDKNAWITVTADEGIMKSIACDYTKFRTGFPGHSQPVMRYKNDRLSKSAILDIELRQGSNLAAEMINLVIPLAAMSRFCRLLTQSRSVETLDLVLNFNHRAKKSHQSRLLGSLGQARGLRRAVVTGTQPPLAVIKTVNSMRVPYTNLAEVLKTVSEYQDNSKDESKHGRTLAARNLVLDGADFVDWWLDEIRSQWEPVDNKEMDELLQARADMGFSCASLSLKMGSTNLAQQTIRHVLERLSWSQRLRDIHKACAHYYMAQIFEVLRWKNAALYSYLQALRIRPGYEDADAAVNRMERDLRSGTTLEDAKVKHNIHHVLNRFRSQPTHSVLISKREYRMIFQKYDGTAAEIHSLDRYTRGETDLIYMNPNY